jgi:glycosyltransferase involved in cell wall biosynthesis
MEGKDNKAINICMIAYTEYYTDARIKSYIMGLNDNSINVYLYCLEDSFSKKDTNNKLKLIYLQKKYQGKNAILYIFFYLLFFIKAFFIVSLGFFKYKFDVIHVHNIPDFIVFCAIIPKIFGKKIILDMHDVMTATFDTKFSGIGKKIIRGIILFQSKISILFSDVLVCANKGQMSYMISEGMKCDNTKIFLNLPNTNYFRRRSAFPNNNYFSLIYHGTITERLGLDLIVKAVELASKHIEVKLSVIGDGELKNELIEYCKSNNLINNIVVFSPFIPVNKLQEELEKHDAGIIGNRNSELSQKIMLPVKLMEYIAVGLPVVSPNLEVIREYIDEDMMLFYSADDVKDMATKIILLSKDSKLRENIIENSQRFFESHNWEKQKEEYVGLIKSLIIKN